MVGTRRAVLLILFVLAASTLPALTPQVGGPDVGGFLPSLDGYLWLLVKGPPNSTFHTGSPAPRVPVEGYLVNVSTNIGGLLATPLVDGEMVFLADGGGVYALDRVRGELIWGVEVYFDDLHGRAGSYPQPVERWYALGLYRLVISYGLGEAVYVATDAGERGAFLLAFAKRDGRLLWEANMGDAAYSNMVVADGRIYVGTFNGRVYCFSEEGEHLWTAELGEGAVRGLAYGDGTLYVSIETGTELYAVDASTGSLRWAYSHDAMVGTPLYVNGMAIFVDSTGKVLAVSREGVLLWNTSAGAGSTAWSDSYLAAGNDAIYASRTLGEENGLLALAMDGRVLGFYRLPDGDLPCQPVVSGPLVLLPARNSTHGKLYILWRSGLARLHALAFAGSEVFCPTVSVSRGEVFAVFSENRVLQVLAVLRDSEAPAIINVSRPGTVLEGDELGVNATVRDARSAIYRVVLAYRVDQGPWILAEMGLARRYLAEPVGGYGFQEELYTASVPGQRAGARVDYLVVAIDNVGNVAYSDTYTYQVGERGEGLPAMLLAGLVAVAVLVAGLLLLSRSRPSG